MALGGVPVEQTVGLACAIRQPRRRWGCGRGRTRAGCGRWAARRDYAAGRRPAPGAYSPPSSAVQQRWELVVLCQQGVGLGAALGIGDPRGVEQFGAGGGGRRLPDDVQAMRDERIFEVEQRASKTVEFGVRCHPPGRLGRRQLHRRRLRLDEADERQALLGVGRRVEKAQPVDRRFEFREPAVEAGMGDGRRQVADQRRAPCGAWRACPRRDCWRRRDRRSAGRRSAGPASTRRTARPACRA